MAALGLVLALSACSGPEETSGPVQPASLPSNLCDLVPDGLVSRWGLVEDSHRTGESNRLNDATCVMNGDGSTQDVPVGVKLELSVTTFGGGGADSALGFADDEYDDRCGNVQSYGGTYLDTDSSCTAEVDSGGVVTVVTVWQLAQIHGVVRVLVETPADRGATAEIAVTDVVAAVESSLSRSIG